MTNVFFTHNIVHVQSILLYILFTGKCLFGCCRIGSTYHFCQRINHLFPLTACIWGEGGDALQIEPCYVQTSTSGKRDEFGCHGSANLHGKHERVMLRQKQAPGRAGG